MDLDPTIGHSVGLRLLSPDELHDVLGAERPEQYLIGGFVDAHDEVVVLYRGDLEQVIVPFSWFNNPAVSARPAFDDFEIVDSGRSVRLGGYVTAANRILCEFRSRLYSGR